MTAADEPLHPFAAFADWDPATKTGIVRGQPESWRLAHAGAPAFGGPGGGPNPEELLLGALATCYAQTWAIFLAKLRLPIDHPEVDARCVVGKDPAGGFRVTTITVSPRVPAPLWAERRADLEKSFELAERYCIVSKVVKGEGRTLVVEPAIA